MAEPLCPRCNERPRHRSPSALQPWCTPCRVEWSRQRRRQGPTLITRVSLTPGKAAADARRERAIADGSLHLVDEVRFARKGDATRYSVCTYGERLEGFATDEAMARAYAWHAALGNGKHRPPGWTQGIRNHPIAP